MSRRVFLDTNVLVYADDRDSREKQTKAQALISSAVADGSCVLSTQILQEYFVIATRKLKVPSEVAEKKVQLYASLSLVEIRASHILEAIKIHRLYQLSLWDSLVIQAASAAGCRQIFSEDLQHGMRINSVEVINPFLT